MLSSFEFLMNFMFIKFVKGFCFVRVALLWTLRNAQCIQYTKRAILQPPE